jgi:hypothetical protein
MRATMSRSSRIWSLVVAIMIGQMASVCEAQSSLEKALSSRRPAEQVITGVNFLQALVRYAAQNEIPIGIEWVKNEESLKPVHIEFNGNVADGLRAFVRRYGDYQLSFDDSVVHVLYSPEKASGGDYYDIPISHFEVHDDTTEMASYRLRLAVQQIINPPFPSFSAIPKKSGPRGFAGHISSGLGDSKITLTIDDTSVGKILDRLTTLSNLKVWIITYPSNPAYIAGHRKTISLYTKGTESIPDSLQPAWTLLIWGADPISGSINTEWHSYPQDDRAQPTAPH